MSVILQSNAGTWRAIASVRIDRTTTNASAATTAHITTHPVILRARIAAAAFGSTATTLRGIVRALRGKRAPEPAATILPDYRQHRLLDRAEKGAPITLHEGTLTGYRWHTRADSAAADRAAEAIGTCGQRRNYGHGGPRVYGVAHRAEWSTINYRGRFKGYHGRSLAWLYQSAVGISPSGRSALVVLECVLIRRIIAPAGMLFDRDNSGIFLRRISDGMDYHPEPTEWLSPKFATVCREKMAENYQRRQAEKRAEKQAEKDAKEAARMNAIFERDLPTVRVTLNDSRRAGNCVEGSLSFAERKLHVPREEIIAGGHLWSIPAPVLLRASNGDRPAVERAIRAAWSRETAVSI